ncbi:hypothetical protein [Enterococcus casseliflavus]|uniref:hypothetical protein n=1 Tax=Enterococcus casseliflavus TaxID=37734 RepID=UPI0039A42FB6
MIKTKFMEELIKIQNEYIYLLELGLTEWGDEYFVEFIEEINLFWKRNENVLNKIYEYEFPYLETVFLTAVTKVDLEYLQHYSMKISGEICLIDDPLISYLNLLYKDLSPKMSKKFSDVIQDNIRDSIELYKTASNDFFILPLRTIIPIEAVTKATKQFFISLFEGISSIEDYFEKINTFEDIELYLKESVKDWILFGWKDEKGVNSLKERFMDFVNMEYMGDKEASISEIFYFSQTGYLAQGMNILFTMTKTNFVPYIRGNLPFRYLTILYGSLKDSLHLDLDQQIIRTSISYFFERIFDFAKHKDLSYEEFLSKIRDLKLYRYVFQKLHLENKELQDTSLGDINLTVNEFYEKEFLPLFY